MQAEPATPSSLIRALQHCRRTGDVHRAAHLNGFLRRRSLESHSVLGNYLVPLLAKCGCLLEAHRVFDSLPHRNEYSWTALISRYIESGEPRHSLHLFQQMQEEGQSVQPNRVTYLALLNACALLKDAEKGRVLHSDIIVRGLEQDVVGESAVVGNTLVDMYGKCGLLVEAQQVFKDLPLRDAVSWTALITGYTELGFGEQVLHCLKEMHLEGVCANFVTFVCCLKACGIMGELDTGHELHTCIVQRGFETALFTGSEVVGNTLVDMYGKCSSLAEACQVFCSLPIRNAVSWTALVAAYAEQGLAGEVLNCLHNMQLESISPNAVTYVWSLKACATKAAIQTGYEIHTEIINRGLETELHVRSTLVDMYTKCCSLAEASLLCRMVPYRDGVLCTALIAGYAEHGLDQEVLNCFEEMELESVEIDAVIFVLCLKACGSTGALEVGHKINTALYKRGLEREVHVGSTLVDMYGKCGSLVEAHRVFDRLPIRNAVLWTALIAGYADHGQGENVLNCFKQMQLESVSADTVIYNLCLKACGEMGALEIGREIHAEIRKAGLERESSLGNMLIDMYGKCGSVAEGREVFDKLPTRDVVSWTAMIKAYGENHEGVMAVQCFDEMQKQGVIPDAVAFTCILAACSHASLLGKGQEYIKTMREHGIHFTLDHFGCIIDLFARSGHVYEAEKFVATMECPPSCETLLALLSACKMYGEVEVGQRCFQQLVQLSQADAAAYMLMADIYENTGRLNDARKIKELRKYAGGKKKPGNALIEVNKSLYGFTVSIKQSQDILEFVQILNLHMKNEGYAPDLDVGAEPSCVGDILVD